MEPIFGPPEGPFVLISGLLGESFWDSSEGPFGTPRGVLLGSPGSSLFGASPDPGLALSGGSVFLVLELQYGAFFCICTANFKKKITLRGMYEGFFLFEWQYGSMTCF